MKGGGGPKNVQNCVTSYKDDPIIYSTRGILYQRRGKNGNEDVRVSHGVEQGHQGHAAVRQSREGLRVKKKFVFGQSGDEKTEDVVNAELLKEYGHADSGVGDQRVGRRMNE